MISFLEFSAEEVYPSFIGHLNQHYTFQSADEDHLKEHYSARCASHTGPRSGLAH